MLQAAALRKEQDERTTAETETLVSIAEARAAAEVAAERLSRETSDAAVRGTLADIVLAVEASALHDGVVDGRAAVAGARAEAKALDEATRAALCTGCAPSKT